MSSDPVNSGFDILESHYTDERRTIDPYYGGRTTTFNVVVDRQGWLIAARLTAGNYHDMRIAEDLLQEAVGRSCQRYRSVPQAIVGDRGYDAAEKIAGFTGAGF